MIILFKQKYYYIFLCIITVLITFSVPDDVKLGTLYFQSYEYDKAYKLLEGDNFRSLTNIDALLKIKDYFKVGGNIPQAVKVQERILELKPKNLTAINELETLYQWNGDVLSYLRTKEKRAERLKNEPDYIALLFEIANEYRWYKQLPDSNRVFFKAYSTGKLDKEQKVQIVEYLLASRQLFEAVKILDELKHEDREYRKYLFEAYREKDEIVKAIGEGLILLTKNDRSQELVLSEEWLDLVTNQELEKKKFLLEDVMELYERFGNNELLGRIRLKRHLKNPSDMSLAIAVAYHYWELGQGEEALKYFYKLKSATKRRIYYFYQAGVHFRIMGDLETSKFFYEKVVKITRKKKYLKSLAEVYEELGLKKKALKLYLELYKQYKSSSYNPSMFFSKDTWYAQSGTLSLKRFNSDRLSKLLKERIEIGKKIIYLMNETGQEDSVEPFYRDILDKNPYDLEALKGLGYFYMKKGDRRYYDQFQLALNVVPEDEDAKLVMADYHVQNKNYDKANNLIEGIEEQKNTSYVQELRFEVYKNRYPEKMREFCSDMYKAGRAVYRIPVYLCYLHQKKFDKAYEISVEDYENSKKNRQDILDYAYVASVSGNFKEAQEAIDLGRKKGFYDKDFYQAEKNLAYYINDKKLRKAITVKTQAFAQASEDLDYYGIKNAIGKRYEDYRLSYVAEKFWFKDTVNKDFFSHGVKAAYVQDKYELSTGILFHDKANDKSNFNLEYTNFDKEHFLLIRGDLNKYEFPGKRALEGNNSTKDEYQVYYETIVRNESKTQSELTYKDINLWNNETPKVLSLSSTYWFDYKWNTYIGPTLAYSKRSGGQALSDLLYLKDSLIYGAYFRRRWEFLERLFPSSNVFLRLGVLGDALNSNIIGELWAMEFNFAREFGLNKSVEFNYRHDQSVTSGNLNGEIDTVNLTINYWF